MIEIEKVLLGAVLAAILAVIWALGLRRRKQESKTVVFELQELRAALALDPVSPPRLPFKGKSSHAIQGKRGDDIVSVQLFPQETHGPHHAPAWAAVGLYIGDGETLQQSGARFPWFTIMPRAMAGALSTLTVGSGMSAGDAGFDAVYVVYGARAIRWTGLEMAKGVVTLPTEVRRLISARRKPMSLQLFGDYIAIAYYGTSSVTVPDVDAALELARAFRPNVDRIMAAVRAP